MLEITGKSSAFNVEANGYVIVHGIPTKEAAEIAVKHFKKTRINWNNYEAKLFPDQEDALETALQAANDEYLNLIL